MKKKIVDQILDPEYHWDSDQSFEVEKILEQVNKNGQKYYLVKWKGFDMAMNTWQNQQKVCHLESILEEFKTRKKSKNSLDLRQQKSFLINPYRATQIHGHFLYGDTPKQVQNIMVKYDKNTGNKQVFLQIIWQPRQTPHGQIPLQNSILDSNTIFEHDPNFLNQFYISKVRLNEIQ